LLQCAIIEMLCSCFVLDLDVHLRVDMNSFISHTNLGLNVCLEFLQIGQWFPNLFYLMLFFRCPLSLKDV